jgi:hypothetical protein
VLLELLSEEPPLIVCNAICAVISLMVETEETI